MHWLIPEIIGSAAALYAGVHYHVWKLRKLVSCAQAEKAKLIEDSKAETSKLLMDAKTEAAKLVLDARKEIADLRQDCTHVWSAIESQEAQASTLLSLTVKNLDALVERVESGFKSCGDVQAAKVATETMHGEVKANADEISKAVAAIKGELAKIKEFLQANAVCSDCGNNVAKFVRGDDGKAHCANCMFRATRSQA